MTRIDNLNANQLSRLEGRVRALEARSPVGFSSVSRGALEISSSEGLIVDGSARIAGSLTGSGSQTWTGTSNLNGPVNIGGTCTISGGLTVSGAATLSSNTTISGNTTMSGTLAVQGATTLTNQLTVSGSGKIVAGNAEFSPSAINGGFGIRTTSGRLSMSSPSEVLLVGPRVATAADFVDLPGALVSMGTLNVANQAFFNGVSTTTSAANARINPTNGSLQYNSSSRRFKDDIEELELDPRLLDVPVYDWVEKGDDSGKRIAGTIAEEVADAGGEAFIEYDADGEVLGLAYERYAIALCRLLADEVRGLRAEVKQLKENR